MAEEIVLIFEDADRTFAHYGAALDEIYRLRGQLALEARALRFALSYSSLPVGVRKIIRESKGRLEAAAKGKVFDIVETTPEMVQAALHAAGASPTLTRAQWEAEQHGSF